MFTLCWVLASLPARIFSQVAQDQTVRLNQIQVIGTHNSYHAGLGSSEMKLIQQHDARSAAGLDYSHPPLAEQLSAGVRQIELDEFPDPQGGRYAHPKIMAQVAAAGLPADPDFDPEHEMAQPGFKVMHVQDVDQRSRCHLLTHCLQEVRTWSKAHPQHLPIFILLECKTPHSIDAKGATVSEPMTPALFDALDKEILSVFTRKEIVTPDEVRGRHSSLREAITTDGWPALSVARGKVIFLLDQRNQAAAYAEGHPALRGRVIFPNADPASDGAAFTEMNDGTPAQIAALVKQGYLVRTRSDWDTLQARSNDTKRRDEAIASGAQIISTDYPASEPARWTNYSVSLADGRMAQCNPVERSPDCKSGLLEKPAAQQP